MMMTSTNFGIAAAAIFAAIDDDNDEDELSYLKCIFKFFWLLLLLLFFLAKFPFYDQIMRYRVNNNKKQNKCAKP